MEAEGDNDGVQLQPGFRFYPTEEELVSFYLHNKLEGLTHLHAVIPVVPVYDVEPWQLPDMAGEASRGDKEQWFFFCPRQEREARGGRPNRTTGSGYWKATGSPAHVYSSDNRTIGIKKTMVFYTGRAPTGTKTKWKMHEYRAIIANINNNNININNNIPPQLRHEFSLCRLYVVSGAFRAFDRRPLLHLGLGGGHHNHANHVLPSSANVDADAASTSSDTSDSGAGGAGGGDNNNNADAGGGASTSAADWNVNDGIIVQEPLWEWEQLNWL